MRAVVFAYHNIGCVGLEALLRHRFDIQAVFTHTDNPRENIWFGSVADLAARRGLPVYAPEDVNHPLWKDRIKAMQPDVFFSFYFRNLISKEILELAPRGAFNLHGSLLPKYRGRCPINWVLVNGETETGVTLHHMVSRADAGDIVSQKAFPIADDDTALSLFGKAEKATVQLLDEVLPLIKTGTAPRTPQDESQASKFGGRKPEDGKIDWNRPATDIRNLVRAVTHPYPGAFTFKGNTKLYIWEAEVADPSIPAALPGTVISVDPLTIACEQGAVVVRRAQIEGSIPVTGAQAAREVGLVEGWVLGRRPLPLTLRSEPIKILILGVAGFIGNALVERLLEEDSYEIYGMDLDPANIERYLGNPRFHFVEGDIGIHGEWIEYHVRKCDIVIPLVAIATPIEYIRNPLGVFELDFEENLRIVRYCVRFRKRLVFPSTSEVYGMCADEEFDENKSNLVTGPIYKQRWIYSASKQLLDRVIWAYGVTNGLRFTLFRPFNWIGPRLDSLEAARIGSSRAITQLILNLVEGSPVRLVDGGRQKRCFTDVRDGVECLFKIIENRDGRCDGEIFNIGNPFNEASIRQLAEMLIDQFHAHPLRRHFPPPAGVIEVESGSFYGNGGYEDITLRKPSIRKAKKILQWEPVIPLEEAVRNTLDFFLEQIVTD